MASVQPAHWVCQAMTLISKHDKVYIRYIVVEIYMSRARRTGMIEHWRMYEYMKHTYWHEMGLYADVSR